jgi:hypothetical protein
VATLLVEETANARRLAGRLARAIDDELALLALDATERDALLSSLEEAETPALAELRGRLVDDAARRQGL